MLDLRARHKRRSDGLSRIPALSQRPLAFRLLTALLVFGAVLAGLLALPSAAKAAQYETSSASALVAAINNARSRAGLRPLAVNSELTAVARTWAAKMAGTGTLGHNPALAASVHSWTMIGENVGMGSSASQIESMFMASAPHRANILQSQFTDVGVGAVRASGGRLWVTVDFKRRSGTTPSVNTHSGASGSRAQTATRSSRSSVRTAVPKATASTAKPHAAKVPTMVVRVPVRFPGAATARLANSAFNSTHHLRPAAGR